MRLQCFRGYYYKWFLVQWTNFTWIIECCSHYDQSIPSSNIVQNSRDRPGGMLVLGTDALNLCMLSKAIVPFPYDFVILEKLQLNRIDMKTSWLSILDSQNFWISLTSNRRYMDSEGKSPNATFKSKSSFTLLIGSPVICMKIQTNGLDGRLITW